MVCLCAAKYKVLYRPDAGKQGSNPVVTTIRKKTKSRINHDKKKGRKRQPPALYERVLFAFSSVIVNDSPSVGHRTQLRSLFMSFSDHRTMMYHFECHQILR